MANCVVCGAECSGDLSNFLDPKTGKDVKDRLSEYMFVETIYQSPVCLSHYHMTKDDWAWMTGTGYYGQ